VFLKHGSFLLEIFTNNSQLFQRTAAGMEALQISVALVCSCGCNTLPKGAHGQGCIGLLTGSPHFQARMENGDSWFPSETSGTLWLWLGDHFFGNNGSALSTHGVR
jgi:hypothetical protein